MAPHYPSCPHNYQARPNFTRPSCRKGNAMVSRDYSESTCSGGSCGVFDVFCTYDLQMPGPDWSQVFFLHIKGTEGVTCISAYFPMSYAMKQHFVELGF